MPSLRRSGTHPADALDSEGTILDVNAITDGEFLKRVGATVVSAAVTQGGTPASQLDANGTTLDVNVITDGEFLKRVGTTVVSAAISLIASQLDANGTTLDVNVITDGEYLKRSGTAIVSAALPTTTAILDTGRRICWMRTRELATASYDLVGVANAPTNLDAHAGVVFTDVDGRWNTFTTSTTSGNGAGHATTADLTEPELLPDITFIIKTGPVAADITDVDYWVELRGAAGVVDATSAANQVAFRIRSALADTTWKCISTDASNVVETTNSLVSLTADTKYRMRIQFVTASSIKFYINDTLVATHSTRFPAATVNLEPHAYIVNRNAGTARSFQNGGWQGTQL